MFFDLLQKHPAPSIFKTSALYRTSVVGVTEQDWFVVNAAVVLYTGLAPQALLELMLEAEKSFGRVRTVKLGPRPFLNLDILFYKDSQLDLPGLKGPHPLMSERLFVLAPLAEIESDRVHPALELTVREMLNRILELDHQQAIHKVGN